MLQIRSKVDVLILIYCIVIFQSFKLRKSLLPGHVIWRHSKPHGWLKRNRKTFFFIMFKDVNHWNRLFAGFWRFTSKSTEDVLNPPVPAIDLFSPVDSPTTSNPQEGRLWPCYRVQENGINYQVWKTIFYTYLCRQHSQNRPRYDLNNNGENNNLSIFIVFCLSVHKYWKIVTVLSSVSFSRLLPLNALNILTAEHHL